MSDLWVAEKQIQAAHCGEPEKVLLPARFSVNAGPRPADKRVIYCVLFPITMQQATTVVWRFFFKFKKKYSFSLYIYFLYLFIIYFSSIGFVSFLCGLPNSQR